MCVSVFVENWGGAGLGRAVYEDAKNSSNGHLRDQVLQSWEEKLYFSGLLIPHIQ